MFQVLRQVYRSLLQFSQEQNFDEKTFEVKIQAGYVAYILLLKVP